MRSFRAHSGRFLETHKLVAADDDVVEHGNVQLVLDNFEHVMAAAPLVAELLAQCPQLKILATSQAQLHLYGEYEYPFPAICTDLDGLPLAIELAAAMRLPGAATCWRRTSRHSSAAWRSLWAALPWKPPRSRQERQTA